jgi:hypothetical protein
LEKFPGSIDGNAKSLQRKHVITDGHKLRHRITFLGTANSFLISEKTLFLTKISAFEFYIDKQCKISRAEDSIWQHSFRKAIITEIQWEFP